MQTVEWITLNLGTALAFILEDLFHSNATAVGILALAFFNIMRGVEIMVKLIKKKNVPPKQDK